MASREAVARVVANACRYSNTVANELDMEHTTETTTSRVHFLGVLVVVVGIAFVKPRMSVNSYSVPLLYIIVFMHGNVCRAYWLPIMLYTAMVNGRYESIYIQPRHFVLRYPQT